MKKIAQKLANSPVVVYLVFIFVRIYLLTVRIRIENEKQWIEKHRAGEPVLICMFHQQFFYSVRFFRKYLIHNPCIMISKSRDGEIAALVGKYSGCTVVRGSSSRGGKAAMEQMIEYLMKRKGFCINLVDGPQGPIGKVKPGSIRIAQKSGAAVIPAFFNSKDVWQVNSWDRLMIPKPFSCVTLRFGKPLYADQIKTREDFESVRLKLEAAMVPYLQNKKL